MYSVVGIRFKQAGKIYYFDPNGCPIRRGDDCIVETVRGIEYGTVVAGIRYVAEDEIVLPLKKVIRVATEEDTQQMEKNRLAAVEALHVCRDKVSEHRLEMRLIDAEYTFDRNKVIFYFSADGRVDFRELVRDLAAVFRTRD